jgi:hypothetical protein
MLVVWAWTKAANSSSQPWPQSLPLASWLSTKEAHGFLPQSAQLRMLFGGPSTSWRRLIGAGLARTVNRFGWPRGQVTFVTSTLKTR